MSYSMGRRASSAAVASVSLMLTLSRTLRDGGAADQVFDFADEVDQRVLGASALGQGEFAARDLDNDGDEIFGPVELEVIDLHGDRKLGDRILEHERVFQLALFVDCGKAAELLVSVVALAVIELGGLVLVEGDFYPAEVAVPGRIAGVVANHVVVGDGFLSLNDAARQVVVIEKGFASGVAGEGVERVLRLLEVGGVGMGGAAGVHAGIAGRALGSVSKRGLGDQAARVHRPEGDAGADSGVDRGVKLGLVINAVEPEPAGEVDERFLLVQLAEHLGRGLQRGELAIGVEDVELAVVLAKRGAGVGTACVVDGLGGALAFADNHGLENAEQLVAIGGEVLQDVDGAALVAQDGDQVDGRHLRAQKLLCGRKGAQLVGRPHGSHIKVEREQAAILITAVFGRFGRELRSGELLVEFDLFRAGRCGCYRRLLGGEILVLAEADRLRSAVLSDGEIFGAESGNEFTLLVFDDNGFDDQLRLGGERIGSRGSGGRVLADLLRSCLSSDEG